MKKHLLAFAVVAGLACVNAGVANADSNEGLVTAQIGYFIGKLATKKTSVQQRKNTRSGAAIGGFSGGLSGAFFGPIGVFTGILVGAA